MKESNESEERDAGSPAEEISTEYSAKDAKPEDTDKTKRRRYLRDLCYIAMFAAVIAVCSQLAVSIGQIPYTLQTLAVCLAAGLLGWKRGTLSVIVYILMGICGIPVFSGFKNFYALVGGASAGYVIGFIFTALVTGLTSDYLLPALGKHLKNRILAETVKLVLLAVAMLIGVAVCYFFGTLWFMFVYKGSATAENLQAALTYCVYPYVWADAIKIAVAAALVNRLKKFVK